MVRIILFHIWMKRGGERQGTRWKSCWLLFTLFLAMSICHTCRSTFFHFETRLSSPGGNLLEIFLLLRFLSYRSTRNFYPLILPSKRGVGRGGKPVFEEKFLRRNSFWERLFNAHPEEEKLFHDGIVSILDFSYCFDVFFSLSLPREKRRNESIETNLFEKI